MPGADPVGRVAALVAACGVHRRAVDGDVSPVAQDARGAVHAGPIAAGVAGGGGHGAAGDGDVPALGVKPPAAPHIVAVGGHARVQVKGLLADSLHRAALDGDIPAGHDAGAAAGLIAARIGVPAGGKDIRPAGQEHIALGIEADAGEVPVRPYVNGVSRPGADGPALHGEGAVGADAVAAAFHIRRRHVQDGACFPDQHKPAGKDAIGDVVASEAHAGGRVIVERGGGGDGVFSAVSDGQRLGRVDARAPAGRVILCSRHREVPYLQGERAVVGGVQIKVSAVGGRLRRNDLAVRVPGLRRSACRHRLSAHVDRGRAVLLVPHGIIRLLRERCCRQRPDQQQERQQTGGSSQLFHTFILFPFGNAAPVAPIIAKSRPQKPGWRKKTFSYATPAKGQLCKLGRF